MNHYINLLEPSEIVYQSSASVPPLFKIGGVVALVLVLGGMGLQFNGLRAKAAEGKRIESRWNEIKEDVEDAKALNTKSLRLGRALDTLEGWPVSQHHWPELLDYFVEKSPVDVEDLQFTRFVFDEKMEGLRDQTPGNSDGKYFPLTRKISITLRGIIRSDRPQRILPEYRRKLADGEGSPSEIADVGLDNPIFLIGPDGQPSGLTEFTYTIELVDRAVKP